MHLHTKQVERGQSTVTIALSLGVLLLLIIGIVILCLALFTATTMDDYDKGKGLFNNFETQDIGSSAQMSTDQMNVGDRII